MIYLIEHLYEAIDKYYNVISSAIKMAFHKAIFTMKMARKNRIIASWNDFVELKHCNASIVYRDWLLGGKVRWFSI